MLQEIGDNIVITQMIMPLYPLHRLKVMIAYITFIIYLLSHLLSQKC